MQDGGTMATETTELAANRSSVDQASVRTVVALRDVWRDYLQLTKPRILLMIVMTALVAMAAAPQGLLSWQAVVTTVVGTALVAASASVFNQWYEIERDSRMERTRRRPLPAGRLTAIESLGFGFLLVIVGLAVFALGGLPLPASIALATWGLYVLLYTPLKSISSINTLIGTLPGALPVLIGWTAGGGSLNQPLGWWMTAVLVLWQLPHFMAIAWLYREQYRAAGFQMLTTVDPTGRLAAWHALLPALALFPVGVLSVGADGLWGWILGIASVLANLGMAWGAYRFWREQTSITARYLLRASLIYLPAMLLVWVLRVCL